MNETHDDRRRLYRLQPAPDSAPMLALDDDARRWPQAQVLDVNLHGVRVRIAGDHGPNLGAGDPVHATIEAIGLAGTARLPGRVVFARVEDGAQIVAIAFLTRPDLGNSVTAEFFSVFNRRGDERERSAPAHARVSALVLNAAGEADGVIDLMLRDHSAKSVGFVVDASTDAFLRDSDRSGLALPRPDMREAVWPAQVRRREADGGAVYYGCTFDARPSR
jgi:hypothetical protein